MLAWFIAAIIVLSAVNGFMVIVLRRIALRVRKQTDAIVVSQLGLYDDLIAGKSEVLRAQQAEIAENERRLTPDQPKPMREPPPQSALPSFVKLPHYVNPSLATKYLNIKQGFSTDIGAAVRELAASVKTGKDYEACAAAVKALNLDAVYGINCLPAAEQRGATEALLGEESGELIGMYTEGGREFDILGFSRFVKERENALSPVVYVYTGNSGDDFSACGDRVVTIYDAEICEGAVICVGTDKYDYSIRKREISL